MHALGGFTPAAVAPPNAITLRKVTQYLIVQRKGGCRGQALSPRQLMKICISYSRISGSIKPYFIKKKGNVLF